ncbi:hypothetical protein ABTY96_46485 [Streptomyces sp. NPDC096057]|uniref:hypothetical protein n=1 Tax=Streptomyces sp. NPDC096057 TaxID=3155543 RepID=UPI0033185157
MPRVKLAHWHDGVAPGAEIDVTDQQLAEMHRDGRVAQVLDPAAEPSPSKEKDQPAQAEPPSEVPADPPRPRKR